MDLNTRIAAAEGVGSANAATVALHGSRIVAVETSFSAAEADIGVLESDLVSKAGEIDSLEVRASAPKCAMLSLIRA